MSGVALVLGLVLAGPAPAAAAPAPPGGDPEAQCKLEGPHDHAHDLTPAPPPGRHPTTDPAKYEADLKRIETMAADEAFAFAAYRGGQRFQSLGDRVRLNAARSRIGMLVTGDPLAEVADYYLALFALRARGGNVHAGELGPDLRYVSYRDPADGFQRSVTLQRQGSRTVVLAGVGDPEKLLVAAGAGMPMGLAQPPGAGTPVAMEFQEGAAVQRASHFVTRGTMSEVLTFYDAGMRRDGWVRDDRGVPPPSDRRTAIVFRRRDDRCTIEAEKQTASSVAVRVECVSGEESGGRP